MHFEEILPFRSLEDEYGTISGLPSLFGPPWKQHLTDTHRSLEDTHLLATDGCRLDAVSTYGIVTVKDTEGTHFFEIGSTLVSILYCDFVVPETLLGVNFLLNLRTVLYVVFHSKKTEV